MISATPLFADDGRVRGAIAAIVDVSEHKRAEEHQQLLLDELQHRVKNILATVGSLATRMAMTTRSVDEFQKAFLSRISAMARVHDLLVGSAWRGAELKSVLLAAIEPHIATDANVQFAGPEITLSTDAAATMGMVFNELATNASKYGALSTPSGRVDVSWQISPKGEDVPRVQLTWTERDGPPVDPASASGFGTRFITRSIEYELNGAATLELARGGLRCKMEFPLSPRRALPTGQRDARLS
jgi:two-component system CheB/CheR fusion protein